MNKTELKILSTNNGLLNLLLTDKPDFEGTLKILNYRSKLRNLQIELIKMQNEVVDKNRRVLILFEGGEFSGKGSAIRAFMERLNPRSARLVALPKPTIIERGEWYFQRYVVQLPKPGEIVFFDRSWYNRAVVEPVNGFCSKKQYNKFMQGVNHFEEMICGDGIILIKLFLSTSKEIQAKRIEMVRKNPLRRWELSKVDENAQKLSDKYKEYQKAMFEKTNTEISPWHIIDSDDQYDANLKAIDHVLKCARKEW